VVSAAVCAIKKCDNCKANSVINKRFFIFI
jgi:hypothetical protein